MNPLQYESTFLLCNERSCCALSNFLSMECSYMFDRGGTTSVVYWFGTISNPLTYDKAPQKVVFRNKVILI